MSCLLSQNLQYAVSRPQESLCNGRCVIPCCVSPEQRIGRRRSVDSRSGYNSLPTGAAPPRGGTIRFGARSPELLEPTVIAPVLPVYTRPDLVFERGEGAWLITEDGKRYLDFTAGVAVNALGHAHPKLVEALTEQANKVWHVSNLFRHAGGERLGRGPR